MSLGITSWQNTWYSSPIATSSSRSTATTSDTTPAESAAPPANPAASDGGASAPTMSADTGLQLLYAQEESGQTSDNAAPAGSDTQTLPDVHNMTTAQARELLFSRDMFSLHTLAMTLSQQQNPDGSWSQVDQGPQDWVAKVQGIMAFDQQHGYADKVAEDQKVLSMFQNIAAAKG
ncbi:hypothetical protein MXD81_57480 [Microbacteriaceae bacterium K1510]|nr:hypothetical protein [Microbacteriaceae bacterium K1510]